MSLRSMEIHGLGLLILMIHRTLTGVDATAATHSPHRLRGAKDRCLRGVALSISAGLLGSSQEYSPMLAISTSRSQPMGLVNRLSVVALMVSLPHGTLPEAHMGRSSYIGLDGSTMLLGGSTQASDVSSTIILKKIGTMQGMDAMKSK